MQLCSTSYNDVSDASYAHEVMTSLSKNRRAYFPASVAHSIPMWSTNCDVAHKKYLMQLTKKEKVVMSQSEEPGLISLSPSRGILINAAQTQKIAATHSEADVHNP